MSFRCRQTTCTNTYNETVGGPVRRGADCMPCYYAGLLRQLNRTPEEVEAQPFLMAEMLPHLEEGGWTWEHVKVSFERGATLRGSEARS